MISGIALLRERTTGTLYRLLATPIRRGEIISGYLLGYGIFAVIQTVLIVGYALVVFKIQILGSIPAIFLINLLLALTALALGLLISTFANSEFQMLQFIPIIVIPRFFHRIDSCQSDAWMAATHCAFNATLLWCQCVNRNYYQRPITSSFIP